jgi:hypothetical protein
VAHAQGIKEEEEEQQQSNYIAVSACEVSSASNHFSACDNKQSKARIKTRDTRPSLLYEQAHRKILLTDRETT